MERRPGDELDPFSYCFIKRIKAGGRRRRARRPGDEPDEFPYCFVKKMNTGGSRRREKARS